MLPTVQRVRELVVAVIAAVIGEDAHQVEHLRSVAELEEAAKLEAPVADRVAESAPPLGLRIAGEDARVGIERVSGCRIDTLEVQHVELADWLPDRHLVDLAEVGAGDRLIAVELRDFVMVERDVEVGVPGEAAAVGRSEILGIDPELPSMIDRFADVVEVVRIAADAENRTIDDEVRRLLVIVVGDQADSAIERRPVESTVPLLRVFPLEVRIANGIRCECRADLRTGCW